MRSIRSGRTHTYQTKHDTPNEITQHQQRVDRRPDWIMVANHNAAHHIDMVIETYVDDYITRRQRYTLNAPSRGSRGLAKEA